MCDNGPFYNPAFVPFKLSEYEMPDNVSVQSSWRHV
jgi:hypothetical protein